MLIVVFAAVAFSSKIVSLSSIIAAAAAPITVWILSYPPFVVFISGFLALMIILRHRENIRRMLSGVEPKFKI